MDRVLKGRIKPGKVFDLELPLAEAADGYRAASDQSVAQGLARALGHRTW
jgi:hypothetical protein